MENELYFDYAIQVWIKDGIVQDCGHPDEMKENNCCTAHRLAGCSIKQEAL